MMVWFRLLTMLLVCSSCFSTQANNKCSNHLTNIEAMLSEKLKEIPFSEARLFPKDHDAAVKKWKLIKTWESQLFKSKFREVALRNVKKDEMGLSAPFFERLTKSIASEMAKDHIAIAELTNVLRYLGLSFFRNLILLNQNPKSEIKREKQKRDLCIYEKIELKVTKHPFFQSGLLKERYEKDILGDDFTLDQIITPYMQGLSYSHERKYNFGSTWAFTFAAQYASHFVIRESESEVSLSKSVVKTPSKAQDQVADLMLLIFLTQFDSNSNDFLIPFQEYQDSISLQAAFNSMPFKKLIYLRDILRAYCNINSVYYKKFPNLFDEYISYENSMKLWEKNKFMFWLKPKKVAYNISPDFVLYELSLIDEPISTPHPKVNPITQIQPLAVKDSIPLSDNEINQLLFLQNRSEIKDSEVIHYLVWLFKESNKIIEETEAFKQAFYDTSEISKIPLQQNKKKWLSYLIPLQSELYEKVKNIKDRIEALLEENSVITRQLEYLSEKAKADLLINLENNSDKALSDDEKLKSLEQGIHWIKSSYINLHQIYEVVKEWFQELNLRLTILYAEPSVLIDPTFSNSLLHLATKLKETEIFYPQATVTESP